MKKIWRFIKNNVVPLCGVTAAVGLFVANNAPNLCWGIWGYEEDMPQSLLSEC